MRRSSTLQRLGRTLAFAVGLISAAFSPRVESAGQANTFRGKLWEEKARGYSDVALFRLADVVPMQSSNLMDDETNNSPAIRVIGPDALPYTVSFSDRTERDQALEDLNERVASGTGLIRLSQGNQSDVFEIRTFELSYENDRPLPLHSDSPSHKYRRFQVDPGQVILSAPERTRNRNYRYILRARIGSDALSVPFPTEGAAKEYEIEFRKALTRIPKGKKAEVYAVQFYFNHGRQPGPLRLGFVRPADGTPAGQWVASARKREREIANADALALRSSHTEEASSSDTSPQLTDDSTIVTGALPGTSTEPALKAASAKKNQVQAASASSAPLEAKARQGGCASSSTACWFWILILALGCAMRIVKDSTLSAGRARSHVCQQ